MPRRAKIVCTIGPATATPERAGQLVAAGMDVARLNLSHGIRDDHARAYRLVRDASDRAGRAVALLADLQGPKIRLGRFAAGRVMWQRGETIRITVEPVVGGHDRVATGYARFADEVRPGDRVLVDDGRIVLQAVEREGTDVALRVVEGGPVEDNKGISLPDVDVQAPALTDKDRDDLLFALDLGVDLVALSFVRSPTDVEPVLEVMAERGRRVPVLAKLEKPQAVERLEAVVDAFDGVMVARGDLGVELPLEQVPMVQKRAIQLCRDHAKPVIVATEMLESMTHNLRPTRAEASDVANAVLDGADALMLSGETSIGDHPIEAVLTMARIIETVERSGAAVPPLGHEPRTRSGAIAAAAVRIGETLDARAVVAFTLTGDTARRIARHHSRLPVLAFSSEPKVRSQLALSWGVETFLLGPVRHTDEMVREVTAALLGIGRFERGERIVIVAGSPPGTAGSTNALRVHELGSRVID